MSSAVSCAAASVACAVVTVSVRNATPLNLPDWFKGALLFLFVISAFVSVCKVFFSKD